MSVRNYMTAAVLAASAVLFAGAGSARAGWLRDAWQAVKDVAAEGKKVAGALNNLTKVSITVRNETDKPVLVVIDTNRDSFVVAPRGQGISRVAHVGDKPTVKVLDPDTKQVLYGAALDVLGTGGANVGWTGKKF